MEIALAAGDWQDGGMRAIWLFLAAICFADAADLTDFKSADGKVIQAELNAIIPEGVRFTKDGVTYLVPWEKLDPVQAQAFKAARWLKIENDRFTGNITAQTKGRDFEGYPQREFICWVKLSPMDLAEDLQYSFWFTRVGGGWEWLEFHEVKMLVDGKPFGDFESRIDTKVLSGGVYENVIVSVTEEQMKSICAAASVEVRVGLKELEFDDEHLQSLRALLELAEWSKIQKAKKEASTVRE